MFRNSQSYKKLVLWWHVTTASFCDKLLLDKTFYYFPNWLQSLYCKICYLTESGSIIGVKHGRNSSPFIFGVALSTFEIGGVDTSSKSSSWLACRLVFSCSNTKATVASNWDVGAIFLYLVCCEQNYSGRCFKMRKRKTLQVKLLIYMATFTLINVGNFYCLNSLHAASTDNSSNRYETTKS